MSERSTFFSYARDNSEFVIDLAKRLKSDGFNVWLDQIDIPPGARWDKEIQSALSKADTMIIVLSQGSVSSENVLDEVSYAIEEGKKIVPVLYEKCDIPFRLRRFQYIDFTQNKDAALSKLQSTLGGKKVVETAPEPQPKVVKKEDIKPVVLREDKPKSINQEVKLKDSHITPKKATTRAEAKNKSKTGQYLLYALVPLLLIGAFFIFQSIGKQKSNSKNESSGTTVGPPDVEASVTSSEEVGSVANTVDGPITEAVNEDELWNETVALNSKTGYLDYLNTFPEGKYADTAQINYEDIDFWEKQSGKNSFDSMLEYHAITNGNGLFAKEAMAKLSEFDTQSGWLYVGRASGEAITQDRIFDVLCCAEFTETSIPKVGDVVRNINNSRRVYPTSDNTSSGDAYLPVIITDQIAIVEDVKQTGSAVILKVKFSS